MKPAILIFFFGPLLAFLAGCSGHTDTVPPPSSAITLLQPDGRLDANLLISGLSLENYEDGTSGAGLKRQRWNVAGLPPENTRLEIIGNNLKDADLLGGYCQEFDQAGNAKWPWSENGTCWKFMRGVLTNTVDKPDLLLQELILKADQNTPEIGVHSFHVLDVELASDGFFFLRRPGRQP